MSSSTSRLIFEPGTIYCGDCLSVLQSFPDECVDLIYIDPPFHSGRSYEVFWGDVQEKRAFEDRFGDVQRYIDYMRPRVLALQRCIPEASSVHVYNASSPAIPPNDESCFRRLPPPRHRAS